ncbi:hypothetical protein H8B13_09460 [Hymenobacter sp. BT188]|uniref:hypothetical protein n=1 Tax=Hymenobacter sp. BT188 TaxID=2763504 RepID=UPI001650EE09|nr:hypothetical protein [Hymenobacter sp. BT188]MBC6607045.1 hypothetical protein [Hymenobacter sp. BT188]
MLAHLVSAFQLLCRFRWRLVLPLVFLAGMAQAQDPQPSVPDTVLTPLETRPDSLRRRFDEERILTGLQAYAKRKTIAGKAVAALFNFTARAEERAGLDATLLDRQYSQHNYKIVRSINITTLDAFGYSINNPDRKPNNFLEKGGNVFHIRTAPSRVRQLLLFRVGEELEPQELSETERLLRQTGELLDARVFVNEATTTPDSVDVQIITKDVFSLSGSLQIRDVDAAVIGLNDVNFMGLGHQFRNRYEYGRASPQPWRYRGSYLVPFRNFVNAQVRYRNEYENKEIGAYVARDFVSINTQYAGAVALDFYDRLIQLPQLPPIDPFRLERLRYSTRDIWLGRALRLKSYDLGYENPARFVVSARFLNTTYGERPIKDYADASLFLGTIGYSVRRYYKDKYLFGFGRTEDVPTGTLLSLTAGYELNELGNRRYYGVRAASGLYSVRRGYLYLSGEFGTFVRQRDRDWQQGLLSTQALYFTRLYTTGNYQWRHFLWNRMDLGFDRRPGEQLLSIEGERGLRGFRSDGTLRGTSRFVLNYEATMYTPVSFLGFRLAGVAFADAAWLATTPGRDSPFLDKPFTGFGLGLRFRNEYTALRTIQILFGFYPRGQLTNNGYRIFENSGAYYDFSDFNFTRPGVAPYQ